MPSPPTYRERLRLEGGMLAGAGAVGSALLLGLVAQASERAWSTVIQLAFVASVVGALGPVYVRRWLAAAQPIESTGELTGEPTALWKPPLVLVVLAALVVVPGELGLGIAGWDAGLRITLGCLLVGLAQAVLLERVVAVEEARSSRRFVRLPDSGAFSGTKLGFLISERM